MTANEKFRLIVNLLFKFSTKAFARIKSRSRNTLLKAWFFSSWLRGGVKRDTNTLGQVVAKCNQLFFESEDYKSISRHRNSNRCGKGFISVWEGWTRLSRSFVKDQGQRRRKRERSPKQASYDKSRYDEITSDSVLKKVEESKHYVFTQDLCMKSKNDLQKTRFPLIFHESRSFLKRKQGKGHNLQTAAKESLPCLDIKANSNEKNLERS